MRNLQGIIILSLIAGAFVWFGLKTVYDIVNTTTYESHQL